VALPSIEGLRYIRNYKTRVGVVKKEGTMLTALENERMWCPCSEHLVRDHEIGTHWEWKKDTFEKARC
jgi:hypothetical protein